MKRWAFLLLLPALLPAQRHTLRSRSWAYQDSENIRRSFTFSGGPHRLVVDNISGYVHVTGGAGAQVEVSVAKHVDAETNAALLQGKQDVTVDMSQEGNTVRLYTDGPFRRRNHDGDRGYRATLDYDIQVPADTELDLRTINAGDIVVKGTTGDYTINGLNGGIEMDNVAGSGTVKTLNGPVKVSFTRNPAKDSTFHSLNGTIEVHFQPGLNAGLKFHTLNGGVYSDFDVSLGSSSGSGMHEISRRNMEAHTGQGGPTLTFDTLNGSIRLYSKTM